MTIALVFLLFVSGSFAFAAEINRRARLEAEAEAIRQSHWLHHNLRAIRAQLGYAFPEAESICNSLETAFPARCTVDLDGLERHLLRLRREHNAAVLARKDGVL